MRPMPMICLLSAATLSACRGTSFSGSAPEKPAPPPVPAQTAAVLTPPAPLQSPAPVPPAPVPLAPSQKPCSSTYQVAATANPYLAGVPDRTELNYQVSNGDGPNPVDKAPDQAPVLVVPVGECLAPGKTVSFSVGGSVSYSQGSQQSDAAGDSTKLTRHQKGAALGKSQITAPYNSLLGVFLDSSDPSAAVAPAALDFSTASARDYASLAPLLGQIFYIGTGKTASGTPKKVVVPAGATRLYFGMMDSYQWNNNAGGFTGAVTSDLAP